MILQINAYKSWVKTAIKEKWSEGVEKEKTSLYLYLKKREFIEEDKKMNHAYEGDETPTQNYYIPLPMQDS